MDLRQLRALVAVADHESFSAAAALAAHRAVQRVDPRRPARARARGHPRRPQPPASSPPRARSSSHGPAASRRELEAIDADVGVAVRRDRGHVRVGRDRHHRPLAGSRPAARTGRSLPQGPLDRRRRHDDARCSPRSRAAASTAPWSTCRCRPRHRHRDALRRGPHRRGAADHPLAELDEIVLAKLAEHALLLEPPGTTFRDTVDAEADSAGVALETHAEVDGMRLLASLAFQGFGAACCPPAPRPVGSPARGRRCASTASARRAVGLATDAADAPAAPARAVRDVARPCIADVRRSSPASTWCRRAAAPLTTAAPTRPSAAHGWARAALPRARVAQSDVVLGRGATELTAGRTRSTARLPSLARRCSPGRVAAIDGRLVVRVRHRSHAATRAR